MKKHFDDFGWSIYVFKENKNNKTGIECRPSVFRINPKEAQEVVTKIEMLWKENKEVEIGDQHPR
jgi:hypothetical protein